MAPEVLFFKWGCYFELLNVRRSLLQSSLPAMELILSASTRISLIPMDLFTTGNLCPYFICSYVEGGVAAISLTVLLKEFGSIGRLYEEGPCVRMWTVSPAPVFLLEPCAVIAALV